MSEPTFRASRKPRIRLLYVSAMYKRGGLLLLSIAIPPPPTPPVALRNNSLPSTRFGLDVVYPACPSTRVAEPKIKPLLIGREITRLLPASTTHKSLPRNAPCTGRLKDVPSGSRCPRLALPPEKSFCPTTEAAAGE